MPSALEPVSPSLWALRVPMSFYGLGLGARMTVAKLPSGGLWVHSPIPLDDSARAAVDALGPVEVVVAPSLVHHLYVGEWLRAYPDARAYGPRGLGKKRKDLALSAEIDGDAPEGWPGAIGFERYEGADRFREIAFVHRPSRTLVLGDLAFNVRASDSWLTRRYLSWSDAYGKFGQSKVVKLLTRDRLAARRSVDRILDLDFDRVSVCHGEVLETGGKEALARAFGWL